MGLELPAVGQTYENRYELNAVLGQGGFATVFRALDRTIGRDVVIKVLSPDDRGYTQTMRARFLREARIFGALTHPNTITMLDFGESAEGLLYMVFEFIDGHELADTIRAEGRLSVDVSLHILDQLLGALMEAHSHGVLHRDIKPANVLLYTWQGDPYRVKLIDFGIAKDTTPNATRITKTGRIIGTLRYMSPEQIFGESLGPPSDIYSLGLVAYEMLVGEPLISGSSRKEMLAQQSALTPLRLPPGLVRTEVAAIVERMVARQAEDRYPSAVAVLNDLRALSAHPARPAIAESGRPAEPPPAPTAPPPEPWLDTKTVGLAAAAGVIVAGVMFALTRPEPPHPQAAAPGVRASALIKRTSDGAVDAQVEPDLAVADQETRNLDAGTLGRDWNDESLLTKPEEPRGTFERIKKDHIYFPAGFSEDRSYPVVVLMQDKHMSWLEFVRQSGWATLADNEGVVLFGSGGDARWNREEVKDDWIASVRRMLDAQSVDRKRVFVVMHGSGGRIFQNMSLMPEVTALVTHSFTREIGQRRSAGRKVPFLLIAPTDSEAYPLEAHRCILKTDSIANFEKEWRKRNSCEDAVDVDIAGGVCTRWSCEVPFESCHVPGGSRWPGTGSYDEDDCAVTLFRIVVEREAEFPSTDYVWAFLNRAIDAK